MGFRSYVVKAPDGRLTITEPSTGNQCIIEVEHGIVKVSYQDVPLLLMAFPGAKVVEEATPEPGHRPVRRSRNARNPLQ